MGKRKADDAGVITAGKKVKHDGETSKASAPAPAKTMMLDDSDASDSEDNDNGGASLETSGFKVNEEYARRFEHNKKREELQRR
jgi:protein KRI1